MKHILIVDDDVAVTNYFKVFIAQTGLFETTVMNDPRKVMPLLEKEEFDIVLLDMDMPNISGMDILHEMNKQAINVSVVVLTGVNDVDLAVKSMKLGAVTFLPKDKMSELQSFLEDVVLGGGKPVWEKFFDKLGDYFNKRFGPDWVEKDKYFKEFKEAMLKQEGQ